MHQKAKECTSNSFFYC